MFRLQLYILRRLASSLSLVILVVSAVVFIGQAVQFLGRTPDVGLGFVVSVLPLFAPVTLALTLPFGFLVAVILTYGRMADDNEVLAARMAGIHPWALVAPGVFAGAALSFVCLLLQGSLAPDALAGQDRVRQDIFQRFVEIVERGARNSFLNRDFKISWKGVEDGELVGVHISKGGMGSRDAQEIHAERAVLKKDASGRTLLFSLKRGLWIAGDGGSWTVTRFDSEITYTVSAIDLLDARLGFPSFRSLTYRDLAFRVFRWPPGDETRLRAERELYGRIAIAISPLAFALCAIPLALLLGKGSRAAAAVLAFAVAIAFYLLWEVGNGMAGRTLHAAPALLASDAVLFAVGGALLARAVRR